MCMHVHARRVVGAANNPLHVGLVLQRCQLQGRRRHGSVRLPCSAASCSEAAATQIPPARLAPHSSGVQAHGMGEHLHGRGGALLPRDVQARRRGRGEEAPAPLAGSKCSRAGRRTGGASALGCCLVWPFLLLLHLIHSPLPAAPLQVLPSQLPHAALPPSAAGGQPHTQPRGGPWLPLC